MKLPITANTLCAFTKVKYAENPKKGGWKALDLVFEHGQAVHKERFFVPDSYKSRIITNDILSHISEVIGIPYQDIEYQYDFESFCLKYIEISEPFIGTNVFLKLLPRPDKSDNSKVYTRLGFTRPVISLENDMEWTGEEQSYYNSVMGGRQEEIDLGEGEGDEIPY